METKPALSLPVRAGIAIATIVLWLISVFYHREGGQIFGAFFHYGSAHWGGGSALEGQKVAERGIFVTAIVLGLLVAVLSAWKLLRAPGGRKAVPELAARWAAWFLFTLGANRFLIQIQSESIHFAQYGFVAFFMSLVLGNPRQGFLFAVFCGFLDEAHQWWYMYFHDVNNLLDWGDMCLNACGAAGGALPFTSLGRIRRYGEGRESQFEGGKPFLALAWLAGLAGLVAWIRLGTNIGHWDAWPFWKELAAHKPWHELAPHDGLPALLVLSMVLYFLVDDRRRAIPVWALALALLGLHLGVKIPDDQKPEAVHEAVPGRDRPVSIAHVRSGSKITIDGKLDEGEWAGATVLTLGSFAPDATDEFKEHEPACFGPDAETKVRALWDERALYVAFECASEDVWARDFPHDHPEICNTPCVEVFLDIDGQERSYYEIEVSAANRVQDLFVHWPETPAWVPDPQGIPFVGLPGWDCKGLETAVSCQGELELLGLNEAANVRTKKNTKGYTVEMAIPWTAFRGRILKEEGAGDGTVKRTPIPGSTLRANFYRVEKRRPTGPRPVDKAVRMPEGYAFPAPGTGPLGAGEWRILKKAPWNGELLERGVAGNICFHRDGDPTKGVVVAWQAAPENERKEKPSKYVLVFSKKGAALPAVQPHWTDESARQWFSLEAKDEASFAIECAPDVMTLIDRNVGGEGWEHVWVAAEYPDGKRLPIVGPSVSPFLLDTYMAWAPPHYPLDFHRPAFFGVLELTPLPPASGGGSPR